MKVTRIFGAALFATAIGFGMISCSNEDDNGIILDDTVQPTIIEEVINKNTDVNLEPTKNKPTVIELGIEAPASKIVIGTKEAIVYLAAPRPGREIVDGTNVWTGTYTINGTNLVIECDDLGTITIPLDCVGDAMIDANPFAIVSATQIPSTATANEVSITRTWNNPSYSAGVYFDKLPIYGVKDADKKDVTSIKELTRNVLDRIIAEDSKLKDEGFDLLSSDIESLTFTADRVYLRFENGRVEESTWKWMDESKCKFKTIIDGKEVVIDVRFEKGTPNKAYFVIDANCTGIGGLGTHTISGRLICTMTEM